MRIVGNDKKLWTDVIIGRKNMQIVMKQRFSPNLQITEAIAKEGISAIKGSVKHKFSVRRKNGKLNFASFPNGKYSTGILKRKSFDGSDYEKLRESTLNIRKQRKNRRGASFILRETSKAIFDGLKIKSITKFKTIIGWIGNDEKLARAHNYGYITDGHSMIKNKKVPARPFIGYSEEYLKNMFQLFRKLL